MSLCPQLELQKDEEMHGHHEVLPHLALTEKDEDKEGEAERRKELAEEGMAQAGQPQKLEEDPDQPEEEQEEQEEEREEPEQEQPDENALDGHIHLPQQVRTGLKVVLHDSLSRRR